MKVSDSSKSGSDCASGCVGYCRNREYMNSCSSCIFVMLGGGYSSQWLLLQKQIFIAVSFI